ncbi:MAG: peptide chain release factor 2 [Planctomycetales bacterium]|nr:peptide chain release factor 2 [Planctomycetales bacterium]MCA9223363.1 peptide chain release factor 2 [Planctomycetales bacterium]
MEGSLSDRAEAIQQRILQLRDSLDYASKKAAIAEIENRMSAPGFWDNQETAQQVVGQMKSLRGVVAPMQKAIESADDLAAMLEMAEEDDSIVPEIVSELDRQEEELEQLELKALLSGPHDAAGAIMSINARDGGTDANDWAEMLLGMYIAWAQANDYAIELLDRSDNEEAGINSATIAIRGPMAYGYLKGETGMHRLVRISPFNAEGKRQTSFAAVDVSPELSDSAEIEILDKDVREDTFRASGAGGQHVNKTSSAIRLTHIPTGTVVQCQNERSQHKNRANAWKMLRAKMAQIEDEKREAEEAAKYKTKARVGFGSQIRNYFLHPDQRVKDARTGYLIGNFHDVLDGHIQPFLDAYLRWRVGQEVTQN